MTARKSKQLKSNIALIETDKITIHGLDRVGDIMFVPERRHVHSGVDS